MKPACKNAFSMYPNQLSVLSIAIMEYERDKGEKIRHLHFRHGLTRYRLLKQRCFKVFRFFLLARIIFDELILSPKQVAI